VDPERVGQALGSRLRGGRGYDALGFAAAAERDEVFNALALASIIEPTSKLDSVRVLDEAGA
jgi:hypothetical protein